MRATRVKELEPGVWEYTDGGIRNARGQIVRKAGVMMQPEITPATARPMLALRREVYLAAAEAGAAAAAGTKGAPEAWGRVVQKRTQVALDNDGAPGVQSAELVGHALGVLGRDKDQQQQPALELRLSGAAVAQLARLLRPGDVVDSTAVELD